MIKKAIVVLALALSPFPRGVFASAGTEGASFLNIPVGAGPAALGSAYTALATDAYAPTWNPSGLGLLETRQLAGQHLSYLESIHYEYVSYVHPLKQGRSIGASIQYLGSGDIQETDITGNTIGEFSAQYAAYSLAYGHSLNNKLSLGITGKLITGKIADVGARAFAFDFGSMYRFNSRLTLAGVLSNVGTQMKFIDQADSLPLAFRLGVAYRTSHNIDLTADAVYRQTGLASFHSGAEWRPSVPISLRIGYRTDTLKGLSPIAGLTMGIGLHASGHEFAYAWVPLGDLGNTHYFAGILRFGGTPAEKRNLIQYDKIKRDHSASEPIHSQDDLMELLESEEKRPVVKKRSIRRVY